MRTKNSLINMVVGVGGYLLTMLLSFISRMIFIRYLSAAYLGVNGLFSDILGMLNLAELGIGSAMTYSMYKPAAENDHEQLGRLMNLYRVLYRAVALFVLVAGLCLLPFLNVLIKGDSGIENLRVIYLLYLFNSVCSYLLSYKYSILQAYQREYVRTALDQLVQTAQVLAQMAVLVLTRNFLLYLGVQIAAQLLLNLLVSLRVDHDYPHLKKAHGLPGKEERVGIEKNIWALSMHRLGNVVVNGTDNLIMSAFVGLTSVGIYSNYKLVTKSINDLLRKVYSAFTGSIGNLGATQDPEYIYRIYQQLDFFVFVFYGYFAAGMALLFNPFIRLVFGENYVFPQATVLVIVTQFYVTGVRQINLQFREALGLFWHDRYKAVAESIINLVVSILLVKRFEVTGVFLGTIISTMTTCFWVEPYVLMRYGIQKDWHAKLRAYFIEYGRRVLVVLGGGVMGWCLTGARGSSIRQFFVSGVLFTCEYLVIIYLVYHKTEEFEALRSRAWGFVEKKLKKRGS